MPSSNKRPQAEGQEVWTWEDVAIQNPGMPEQLAGYVLILNPVVCPKCMTRLPQGTEFCSVCGQKIALQDEGK